MIKASELRIGNYIIIDGTPAVIKTLNIPDNELLWINYVQGFKNPLQTVDEDGPWPPDRYNPIPLTPEWLERCGFEKKSNEMQIDGMEMILHIDDSTYFSSCGGLNGSLAVLCLCRGNYFANNLQYLHQLQNLFFALTGEELTINHEHLQGTS